MTSIVQPAFGALGLGASPLLMIPALTGAMEVARISRVHALGSPAGKNAGAAAGRDDWRSFARMSVAIVCRSIVFVGIGSFIVLFMHQDRGVSRVLASASLFVFYTGGAFGTAIGGHLARRWPRTSILRWSYLTAVPVVAGMLLIPGPPTWAFIALAEGVGLKRALLPLIALPLIAFLVLLGTRDPQVRKATTEDPNEEVCATEPG